VAGVRYPVFSVGQSHQPRPPLAAAGGPTAAPHFRMIRMAPSAFLVQTTLGHEDLDFPPSSVSPIFAPFP